MVRAADSYTNPGNEWRRATANVENQRVQNSVRKCKRASLWQPRVTKISAANQSVERPRYRRTRVSRERGFERTKQDKAANRREAQPNHWLWRTARRDVAWRRPAAQPVMRGNHAKDAMQRVCARTNQTRGKPRCAAERYARLRGATRYSNRAPAALMLQLQRGKRETRYKNPQPSALMS